MKESVLLRGRKLLLADDSLAIQKVIELTFEDEGMEVVSVGNGQLALARLEEVRPDILLIDVVMPGLSGYEVCQRIRQHEQFHHTPVILLVGSFEPFNEAEARRVGADDYLTKPFQSIRQMVSKVGSLLTGRKSEEEDAATQRLPTPPEHEGRDKGPASADNLELTTADTAPLPQHLAAENQDAGSRQHKRPFADLQLDDEMIEETPASRPGLTNQTAALPSHQRPTEPLRPREMADAGISSPSANATTGQQMTSSGTDAPVVEMHEVAGIADAPPATTARNPAMTAAPGDDRLLDLDDVEMPRTSAMAEADDFILDLQDAAEAQPRGAASSEAAPVSFADAQPATKVYEIEMEAELTEEPPLSASQGAEFTEAQIESVEQHGGFAFVPTPQTPAADFRGSMQEGASSSPVAPQVAPEMRSEADSSQMQDTHELRSEQQTAPTEQLREIFQADETPAAAEADNAVAPTAASAGQSTQSQPGQIGVEQLSPEAIDAIARRVVEQLSTKVIEQIAWEVVPQLSELLIKRRLEEGKQ